MNTASFSCLPLGVSDFHKLRETGKIYVDKTELIYQLASEHRQFLFTRPRRFGKSLLISTFESLFKNGVQDFSGLAIEKKWKDRAYQVIRLDFSNIKDFSSTEEFLTLFNEYLFVVMRSSGIGIDGVSPTSGLKSFFTWIRAQSEDSLVVLIDEYDAPLTASLDNLEFFNFVQKTLSDFFDELRLCQRCFRFLFITGIIRFNIQILFSSFDLLTDISLSPEYGKLLGFDKEELIEYFQENLCSSAAQLDLAPENLEDNLEVQYGGFCFEESASQRVMAPWSVLSFLSEPDRGFRPYWVESGGGIKSVEQFLTLEVRLGPEKFDEPITIELEDLGRPGKLSAIDLLTQAGYLSLKSIEDHKAEIGYPNEEIRRSFAQFYTLQLLGGKTIEQIGADNITNLLADGDTRSILKLLNRLLSSINYQGFPTTNGTTLAAFAQVLFIGVGLRTIWLKQKRILMLQTESQVWKIDFSKFSAEPKKIDERPIFRASQNTVITSTSHGKIIRTVFCKRRKSNS